MHVVGICGHPPLPVISVLECLLFEARAVLSGPAIRAPGRPAQSGSWSGCFQLAIPVGNSYRLRIHWTIKAAGIKLVNMRRRLKVKSAPHLAANAFGSLNNNATRSPGKEVRPAGRTAFRCSGKALLRT
jgi:hypothetical protein